MNASDILKKTGILLVVMLGLAFAIGYALPEEFHVERTLVINAPPGKVFTWINDLKQWPQWDPWSRADPDIRHRYDGQPGVGQRQTWQGPKSGHGTLTVVESRKPRHARLEFKTTNSDVARQMTFTLDDLGGRTRLKWAIDGKNSLRPIGNWFGLGMDRYLGPMYEQGLSNLKALNETGKLPPEVKTLKPRLTK
jgi:uncharacterized protein YndB with AHSA1/START domain